MVFISVVRDFAMYERLVRGNPNNAGAEFVVFDNNKENLTIPVRYNSFLEGYDYSKPDWFVFLHEDFEFLEPVAEKLKALDEGAIYGVFGAKLRVPGVGLQIDSNKDGSEISFRGSPVSSPTVVDTVDCACLAVHSSLVAKHNLRFDEKLTYDLYTEDFGIAAKERFNIATKVFPVKTHHYSYGNVVQRFYDQLEYLNEKYADASRVYVTTTCYAIGRASELPAVKSLISSKRRIPFKWLFYRKISHKGRLTVKVLGIPVWSQQKYRLMMRILTFLVAAAVCVATHADCLDELMPRPREVIRGSGRKVKAPEGPGAYQLTIRSGKPSFAGDEEGRRYAKATFAQLSKLAGGGEIPDCTINDWPEFKYRGLMLDCGRNYQSVESIKDVISMLAAYKFNVFHWHLTDNYGWRLESKRHPELQRKEAFSRQAGMFYTQAEFKEVLAHARRRGVTVVPELDMPGHTLAFRKATGIGDLADERAKAILGELIDELCSLATKEEMPIIHLGTDEARERGEKVPQGHLDWWAKKVTDNGRVLMGWSPGLKLPGQGIKQLWMGANDPRGDRAPYIDSQNSYYINHVDPEELLSVAAYQQPCRWGAKAEKLGAIIGVWHDDAIAETEDVARMNAVYPAIVLLSDNFWRGREKDEPGLYARLPRPDDPRFELAADLERRTIAQRDKVLAGSRHPFPYVAQTAMRWRMTDGEGRELAKDIPQATVYPRHFWGCFQQAAYAPGNGGTVVLETVIESPRDMECGAWIGMTGFSRSDGRSRDGPTPKLGEWNKHGATIELNGERIDPPKWAQPGTGGNPKEIPLVDEDYWYREPTRIKLKKGENRVKLTLPKRGGWKWIGTFVPMLGTSDHPREVPGLKYR